MLVMMSDASGFGLGHHLPRVCMDRASKGVLPVITTSMSRFGGGVAVSPLAYFLVEPVNHLGGQLDGGPLRPLVWFLTVKPAFLYLDVILAGRAEESQNLWGNTLTRQFPEAVTWSLQPEVFQSIMGQVGIVDEGLIAAPIGMVLFLYVTRSLQTQLGASNAFMKN